MFITLKRIINIFLHIYPTKIIDFINMNIHKLNYLEQLEAESVYIFREVAAQFEKPALLFSGGKDSILSLIHI